MVASAYPEFHLEPQPIRDQSDVGSVHYDADLSDEEDELDRPANTSSQNVSEESPVRVRKGGFFSRIGALMHPRARRGTVNDEAASFADAHAQVSAVMRLEERPEHRMLESDRYSPRSVAPTRAQQQHLHQYEAHRQRPTAAPSSQHFFEQGYSTPRGGTRLDSVAEDPAEAEDEKPSYRWVHVLGRGRLSDEKIGWQKVEIKPLPPAPGSGREERARAPRRGDYGHDHASRLDPPNATLDIPASQPSQQARNLRKIRGARELRFADDSGYHSARSSLTSSPRSHQSDHVQHWDSTQDPRRDSDNISDFVHQSRTSPLLKARSPERNAFGLPVWPRPKPALRGGGLYGFIAAQQMAKLNPPGTNGFTNIQRYTKHELSRPVSTSRLAGRGVYYADNGPNKPPTRLYSHDQHAPDPSWVDMPKAERILVKKPPVRQVKSMPVLLPYQTQHWAGQQRKMRPCRPARPMSPHIPAPTTPYSTKGSADMVPAPLRTRRSSPSISCPSIDSAMDHWNRTILVPNTDGRLQTVNGLASQASMSSLGERSIESYHTASAQMSMPDMRIRYRQSSNDLHGSHTRTHGDEVRGQMLKFQPPVRLGARVGRNGSIQSKDYGQIGAGYSGMMSSLTRYASPPEPPSASPRSQLRSSASQQPQDRYMMSGGLGPASTGSKAVSISALPEVSVRRLNVRSAVCVDVASDSGEAGSAAESGFSSEVSCPRSSVQAGYKDLAYVHHYEDDDVIGIGTAW